MVRILLVLGLMLSVMGCESTAQLQTGGYKMIQMNNPECMGQSGSGILLIREADESIIKAQIGQKTGYCEAITGQVISTGGDVAGDYLLKQGLKDSGSQTNTVSTSTGGGVNVPPDVDANNPQMTPNSGQDQ